MLFVSPEDVSKIEVKAKRGNSEPLGAEIYRGIGSIPVEGAVVINKVEWPYKNQPTPGSFPRRFIPRGAAYRVNALATENGWIIRRVK